MQASGIMALAQNKEGKTWQDIDAFYKQLPARYTEPKHLLAVQRKTIQVILDNYQLAEQVTTHLAQVEYYINELQRTQAGYPSLYAKIIQNLRKSTWEVAKIEALKATFVAQLTQKNKSIEAKIKQQKAQLQNESLSPSDKKILQISTDYLENHLKASQQLKEA